MKTPTSVASIDDRRIDDRRILVSNRRISPRTRTLKGAQIIWPNGAPVRCIVRNISETGAKLEVYDPVLQNTFDLVFDLDQLRRSCHVVWRKEPLIGVKFL
jgi:PilZ domain-containing protein